MKKTLLLIIILLSFVAAASADASSLTFAELQNELDTYNLKLWNAGNWSSVIIPNGTYTVGKDLPEGSYAIRSATSKMNCWFTLYPAGSNSENYSEDPRYLDLDLKNSSTTDVKLIDGDVFSVVYAGVQFMIDDYVPRFNPDPDQDKAVRQLRGEYDALMSELKSRPEWREIEVPEGLYEVGPKIPVDHWTIWPKDSRAGVHYGKPGFSEINAALKDHTLKSFIFGYHEGWVSIDMKEGYFVKIDGPVIFTPYIGTTPFQFNE